MIVLPGRRFGVASPTQLVRLLRTLTAVFSRDVDDMIDAARNHDWDLHRRLGRRWANRVLDVTDTRLEIVGLSHVDVNETYVVASLHDGFADALALMNLPLPLAWVARDELADWRRLDAFLDTPAAFTLSPEEPVAAMRTMLSEAPRVFESGRSLVVFPQGTLLGIEAAFSPGAFRIADRFGRPLLPVVVTGSHRVYEYPFSPRVRFGQTIRMEVLPAVEPGSAMDSMSRIEREMQDVALAARPGPRRYRPQRDGFWDGYAFEISARFDVVAEAVGSHRRAAASDADAKSAKPLR
ncbi:MAG: 1-acyl-sn-glycerol-3-phosphate acyltransferase [Acidimicrobiia bacterium]|nr:1-acyl-sn-glycerol-3-phosphate acyltransferase [Acidimicrobiia bacterium]